MTAAMNSIASLGEDGRSCVVELLACSRNRKIPSRIALTALQTLKGLPQETLKEVFTKMWPTPVKLIK